MTWGKTEMEAEEVIRLKPVYEGSLRRSLGKVKDPNAWKPFDRVKDNQPARM